MARKINKNTLKKWNKVCKDFHKVDGYSEMMGDESDTKYVHHRFGECTSKEDLITCNQYYNVEPWCLKFIYEFRKLKGGV